MAAYLETAPAETAARVLPAPAARALAVPAILALASVLSFVAVAPRAPRLALLLHDGAAVVAGRGFEIGWLGSLGLYLADSLAGYAGTIALSALALLGLGAFVYARARYRAAVFPAFAAALFALFTCYDAARLGDVAPAWLGAAAFLYALDRAPRRSAWFAPAVALLWCNVSPAGVTAPALALLVMAGRALAARDFAAARAYVPLTVASALATLLTPAGFHYPLQAVAALHLDQQFARILPIAPGVSAPHAFRVAATLVVLGALWLWSGKQRATDAPLVIGAFVLCFCDGAFVPLLGIVAGPAFAAAAQRHDGVIASASRGETLGAGVAAALVVFVALGVLPHTPARAFAEAEPRPLLSTLSAGGGTHVVFCAPLAACDYAETLPGLRPFLDERVDAASAATLAAQEQIARVRAGWRALLLANHIDAILVARSSPLAQLVPALPGWTAAGGDADSRLFVRSSGPAGSGAFRRGPAGSGAFRRGPAGSGAFQ